MYPVPLKSEQYEIPNYKHPSAHSEYPVSPPPRSHQTLPAHTDQLPTTHQHVRTVPHHERQRGGAGRAARTARGGGGRRPDRSPSALVGPNTVLLILELVLAFK